MCQALLEAPGTQEKTEETKSGLCGAYILVKEIKLGKSLES